MQRRCPLGSFVPPVPQKQRVSMGPYRRQKSAYQVQYLEFEKRLASKRRGRLPIIGVPSRRSSVRESLNSEEYLALAKQLKHNKKEILFGEDKENNLVEPQFDELVPMRGLLDKMKCRYLPTQESAKSRVLQQQYSQQINCLPTHEQESASTGNRSRALTTALHPLKDSKDNNNQNSGIRFLDYKKGRAWMRNE